MKSAKNHILSQYLQEHPSHASLILVKSGSKAITHVIQNFDTSSTFQVLNLIPPSILSSAMLPLEDYAIAKVLEKMQPNVVARVLGSLKLVEPKRVQSILTNMNGDFSKIIYKLINYPKNSIGMLMNPTAFTVAPDFTIREVLKLLTKQKHRYGRYIFVTNTEGLLVGVLPFKDAFYAPKDGIVSELMTSDVFSFSPELSINEAFRSPVWKKWDLLPITDVNGSLLGVLRFDVIEQYVSPKDSAEGKEDIIKASEAVGEVFKIGMKATVTALGLTGDKH